MSDTATTNLPLATEENPSVLAHHFDDLAQQKNAVTLGMWAFLATEVMFFGGLFMGYIVYRSRYPDAFAVASQSENWLVGAINTAVLLCSSLTVVLAVHEAHSGNNRGVIKWYAITIVLGLIFLGVKAYEYSDKFHHHHVPGTTFHFEAPAKSDYAKMPAAEFRHLQEKAQIFFSFYFAMTGLHALHMIVGIGIFLWVMWKAHRRRFSAEYYNPVEISGLYWHFVDIVWIFLYPLFYLIHPL